MEGAIHAEKKGQQADWAKLLEFHWEASSSEKRRQPHEELAGK
jgi:hypothetical protein